MILVTYSYDNAVVERGNGTLSERERNIKWKQKNEQANKARLRLIRRIYTTSCGLVLPALALVLAGLLSSTRRDKHEIGKLLPRILVATQSAAELDPSLDGQVLEREGREALELLPQLVGSLGRVVIVSE